MSVTLSNDPQGTKQTAVFNGQLISALSDSVVCFSASVKSIYQQAVQRLLEQNRYVTRINSAYPDQTGTVLLLGSQCVSIVDSTDTSDQLSTPSDSHTINIFDGCKACNDCDSIWQVAQLTKQCHMWTVGLKDCALYHQAAAGELWHRLFSDRRSDSQGYIVDTSGNCRYYPQLKQEQRRQRLGRATKLLYQYKATVAMWNYLVYNASSKVRVQTALEDFTGIVIKLKRRFNLCDSSVQQIRLDITASRTGQPISGFVSDSSDPSDAQPLPYALSFCVQPITQNTYLQRYTDRGGRSSDAYVDRSSQAVDVTTVISYQQQQSVVQSSVLFIPGIQGGQITCSAQLRILPVFQNIENPDIDNLSLSQYAQAVRKNAKYYTQQMTLTNRWYVHTKWTCLNAQSISDTAYPSLQDATYYTTAYNLYPTRALVQTQQEQ